MTCLARASRSPWTFNVADASIVCAAALIALLAFTGRNIEGPHTDMRDNTS